MHRIDLSPGVVQGNWWHRRADGRIQCDLCPRHCRLHVGQHGFCFIRKAAPTGMVLASYGRASGFCIDPIEKKPLNHFYPGSSVLSFGTAGCNLGCKFCQNWSISKAKQTDHLTEKAKPDEIAKAAVRSNCRGIAFTYNDPVIFAEYAIDTAIAAHDHGLQTVAVTAGYITRVARKDFFKHIDAANVDLKSFNPDFYRKLCYGKLDPVLENLAWLARETDVWLEVTMLLIPGYNDSYNEIAQLCDWFVENLGEEIPLHFTAFHPDFKMRDVPATPRNTLIRTRKQALEAGLKHVYTGNMFDPRGQSTYCGNCGALLIERNGYILGKWALKDQGICPACQQKLTGHFSPEPGNWGSRRQPISFT